MEGHEQEAGGASLGTVLVPSPMRGAGILCRGHGEQQTTEIVPMLKVPARQPGHRLEAEEPGLPHRTHRSPWLPQDSWGSGRTQARLLPAPRKEPDWLQADSRSSV